MRESNGICSATLSMLDVIIVQFDVVIVAPVAAVNVNTLALVFVIENVPSTPAPDVASKDT